MNRSISSRVTVPAGGRRRSVCTYALAALLISAGLAACSDPADSTGGSTPIVNAPDACAPLRAPRAVLDFGIAGGCVACRVVNAEAVVDADPENFATLQVGIGVAGSAFISVFDSARVSPPGTRVGFLVAGDDEAAIPLTVAVGQQTAITTFLNGAEQDSTSASSASPPVALQILDLPLVLPGSPFSGTRFVGLVAEQAFDEVRLNFGGGVNLLNSLQVVEACISNGG